MNEEVLEECADSLFVHVFITMLLHLYLGDAFGSTRYQIRTWRALDNGWPHSS